LNHVATFSVLEVNQETWLSALTVQMP
jgi:hypothetical protein